ASQLFDTGCNSSTTTCACPQLSKPSILLLSSSVAGPVDYKNAAKPIKPAPTKPMPDWTFKLPAPVDVALAAAPLAEADTLEEADGLEAELEPVVVAVAAVPEAVVLVLAPPEATVEEEAQPAEAG